MKKTLIILTSLFFAVMLFLTLFSRQIHNYTLPKVTASRLTQEMFPFEYTDENGRMQIGSREQLAISKALYESKKVYVIYSAEKNGEKRDFVRLADIEIGAEKDGFYEIVSGISRTDLVAILVKGALSDGCEVVVE